MRHVQLINTIILNTNHAKAAQQAKWSTQPLGNANVRMVDSGLVLTASSVIILSISMWTRGNV